METKEEREARLDREFPAEQLPEPFVMDIKAYSASWFEKCTWAQKLLEVIQKPGQRVLDPERKDVKQEELLLMFMVITQFDSFKFYYRATPLSDVEVLYAVTSSILKNKNVFDVAQEKAKAILLKARESKKKERGEERPEVTKGVHGKEVTARQAKEAFEMSQSNYMQISQSGICGCFNCQTNFEPDEILEWELMDGREKTALCPNCTFDTVVGSKSGLPVENLYFLKSLHDMLIPAEEKKE